MTGAGYLDALIADNTKVTFSPIQEINEKGIRTEDGQDHEFDVIICATGFQAGFCPFFELTGRDGVKMQDVWTPDPK